VVNLLLVVQLNKLGFSHHRPFPTKNHPHPSEPSRYKGFLDTLPKRASLKKPLAAEYSGVAKGMDLPYYFQQKARQIHP
jgi:hypothetical protein